ncbi:YjjG family noncanonical pyrimidine nucleotidase [Alkalicoccus chagannorensis]|uniref:YjjG family noncanonical pyrimidine nucleotidase n=1 Tax=Alkalicoccus chagannorensis TaxID=427072 RepID=UPI0003F934C5|nr:YjjG family noncanonical pyrimidine nucleotidase [Alkalicoccus chagannorensis]
MNRVLLFDLDDTLLDFRAAQMQALREVFRTYNMTWSKEKVERYQVVNRSFWSRYEQGLIGKKRVLEDRFTVFLQQEGIAVDGGEADAVFRSQLEQSREFIDGAQTVLDVLAETHRLFIVTNGAAATQRRRLVNSGIEQLVEGVFISEEIGAPKPSSVFFDHVFNQLPDVAREEAVIIGDSLEADILGGSRAGLETIWFNQEGRPLTGEAVPDHIVTKLPELLVKLDEQARTLQS